jgi:hypothetical protein
MPVRQSAELTFAWLDGRIESRDAMGSSPHLPARAEMRLPLVMIRRSGDGEAAALDGTQELIRPDAESDS